MLKCEISHSLSRSVAAFCIVYCFCIINKLFHEALRSRDTRLRSTSHNTPYTGSVRVRHHCTRIQHIGYIRIYPSPHNKKKRQSIYRLMDFRYGHESHLCGCSPSIHQRLSSAVKRQRNAQVGFENAMNP